MTIERVLAKVFRMEEINGGERCPTYLYRWTLFQPRSPRRFWRGFGVYLHKFVGDDWSRDLHDHPKRFISIGLKGRYIEETPERWSCARLGVAMGTWTPLAPSQKTTVREYRAPWLRTFPATHVHRIALLPDRRPCWTLVIVLRSVREWGFWNAGRFIHWRTYVAKGNPIADSRKACP